jgi:hypothetical protein
MRGLHVTAARHIQAFPPVETVFPKLAEPAIIQHQGLLAREVRIEGGRGGGGA